MSEIYEIWKETIGPECKEAAEDIPPLPAPEKWDYETDVVIVGGGGSGLCAAAAAIKNGASVIVVEMNSETGGHSQHAGASACFGTKAAKRARLKFNRAKAFKHAYVVQSNCRIDPRILATLIDRSKEVFDWSETQSWGENWYAMNIGYIPDQGVARLMVKGSMPDGVFSSGTELIGQNYPWLRWLTKFVEEENNQKIMVNTKVVGIVKEGARVTGIKAETRDGKTLYIKGIKAVILAASGFTNNRAMLEKYCPDVARAAAGTFLPPSDTGEVTRMAFGLGADIAGRNSWMSFSGAIPFYDTEYTKKDKPGPWFQYLREGYLQLVRGNGWLEVNSQCEEYIPEAAHADYEMHPKATSSMSNPYAYVIFDDNFRTDIWETLPPPMLDDRPMTKDDNKYPWYDKFAKWQPKDWLDSVQNAIDMGGIKVADTIEELAEQLGLDPVKLRKAVEKWNAKSAAGKRDEFGRIPQNMKPIKKRPFYGVKTGALLAAVFCGPRVNYKMQILDKNQEPIPGLYGAGTFVGGTTGEGVFNPSCLSAVGLAFVTGWIAGDNATNPNPTYEPKGMSIDPDSFEQKLMAWGIDHFPSIARFILNAAFAKGKKKKKNN